MLPHRRPHNIAAFPYPCALRGPLTAHSTIGFLSRDAAAAHPSPASLFIPRVCYPRSSPAYANPLLPPCLPCLPCLPTCIRVPARGCGRLSVYAHVPAHSCLQILRFPTSPGHSIYESLCLLLLLFISAPCRRGWKKVAHLAVKIWLVYEITITSRDNGARKGGGLIGSGIDNSKSRNKNALNLTIGNGH
jgi:hypothetical protein